MWADLWPALVVIAVMVLVGWLIWRADDTDLAVDAKAADHAADHTVEKHVESALEALENRLDVDAEDVESALDAVLDVME